jgi:hypothetical protein
MRFHEEIEFIYEILSNLSNSEREYFRDAHGDQFIEKMDKLRQSLEQKIKIRKRIFEYRQNRVTALNAVPKELKSLSNCTYLELGE